MPDKNEIKVNARGLTTPGPRMMIETALSDGSFDSIRVVVSHLESVGDVEEYLKNRGATVHVDQVGEEFHIHAEF